MKASGVLVWAWAAGTLACSAGRSPTMPLPSPTPTPLLGPTAAPIHAVEQGCSRGHGVAEAKCARSGSQLLRDMDAAIGAVVLQHPEYFNLKEEQGAGGYRLLARDAYLAALVEKLGEQGVCGAVDMFRETFLVKRVDDRSEQFSIDTIRGFLRRGEASYLSTCAPAAFPLEPKDVVVKMFVGLYAFKCVDGFVPPHPDDKKLPMQCLGYVTATPKDEKLRTVPAAVHGSDIQWFVRNGEQRIVVGEEPSSTFNKTLDPRLPGEFSICATVLGVTSCLNGEVLPE